MIYYRRCLWLLAALSPWPALRASSSSSNAVADGGTDILPTILEVEKALLKHPIDEDLAALERELDASIETALAEMRQAVAATMQDRESIAMHNRQVIEATIGELEKVMEAVGRKRQMEKTSLDNEALLKEQVVQMEREEQEIIVQTITKTIHSVVNATDFSTPCFLTASVAAAAVHQGLQSYAGGGGAGGQPDLLQTPGTQIIHQLTTVTYDPPVTQRAPLFRLGDWTRYLPVDVEAVLSSQPDWRDRWPDWTIPNLIPAHVWHTIGASAGVTTTSAPPQAILQPHVQPGHCWPSVRPKVVIQLIAPAVLSAITIDHVPAAALGLDEDDKSDKAQQRHRTSSAPKHFQVYSYSPIADHGSGSISNNNNNGLLFDRSSRKLLLEGNFDASSGVSSVQTFSVKSADEVVNHGDGSCSTIAPSCQSGVTVSAAIEVVVLSNWGNPDYTCLYRVRAHGSFV